MCINDWRAGSLIRTQPTAYSLLAAETATFPANPLRVGITIFNRSGSAANTASLSVDGVIVGLLGALGITHEFHWTLATHGDVSTRAIVITGIGGTSIGGVLEYIAPHEYITAALEEFQRQYPPQHLRR